MLRFIRPTCLSAALIAALYAAAPAQEPSSQPAPQTQPSTAPAKFSLNFKDVPLDTVLDFFSKSIGFQILKEGTLDARVTMISRQAVSPEEAILMLNAALKANGMAVSREGQLLHIKSRDVLKKGNVPVHFGNKPDDIPDTDEIITQVIPIDNVNATKLREDLKPLIGPDADVTANEGSNSIIITDSSSSIRRLVKIISQLDEHEATTSELRIVQLKHANAVATGKLIDSLFKTAAGGAGPSPQQQMMMQRGMGMQPGQPGGAEAPGSQRHGGTVITAADERTNTLLIMASSTTLKVIDEVLTHVDADNTNPAPPTDMRAFVLKYAEADATAKLINNIFKPASGSQFPFFIFGDGPGSEADKGPGVNAVSDDRTNTVIVTAPTEKLKAVDTLIQQLDASPMVSQDLRVIHLQHADPDRVQKIVEDMFEPKKDDEDNQRGRFFILSLLPQEQRARAIKVNVTSDERTNSLLVSAPTGMLDAIEKVVKELDSDSSTEDALFIYHLRNGQANHLEYTLNVLFGNVPSPNQNGNQNGLNQQNNLNQQNQQNSNGIGRGSSLASTQNPASNNRRSSNGNTNQNQRGTPGMPPAVAQGINELTGQVLVVAEPDTNSLLVTTSTKYEAQVKAIIGELDRPVPQVLIKVLVAEVTHDNSLDLGADFSVLNLRPSGNGQNFTSTLGAAAAAVSATTPPGIVARLLETNVTATLQALAQANKLDVLSRPYILTSDNQDANITVGNEVPFITGSFTDANGGIHNTVEYQDIGIILDVTPHINPDGLVVMDVNPQISALTGETVSIQQGVSVPVFELRSASSRVAIKDGQTIVIGGLMQDQKTDNVSKIPLLGDIPLLGALFRYSSTTKTKTELLIFLTPHVVQEPEKLQGMSDDETKGTRLLPGAVEPGTFEEHMRNMRRGEVPSTQPAEPVSPVKSIDLKNGN